MEAASCCVNVRVMPDWAALSWVVQLSRWYDLFEACLDRLYPQVSLHLRVRVQSGMALPKSRDS